MGVDSDGNCVWWDGDEPQQQLRWECLSDGTCEQSASSRATFESEDACLAGCAHSWECISEVPQSNRGARYCLPIANHTISSGAGSASTIFTSAGACEAACEPAYSQYGLVRTSFLNLLPPPPPPPHTHTHTLPYDLTVCSHCQEFSCDNQ
eukprot:SAG11_NODE_1195_length_5546_cov_3.668809_2_plen_151_part_00